MSTPDSDAQEYTRRLKVDVPRAEAGAAEAQEDPEAQQPAEHPPAPTEYAPAAPEPVYAPFEGATASPYVYPYEPQRTPDVPESVLYVPLAVTVGDGFKFGCGFFMAAVAAALLAFVLMAALFLLSSLTGITLPLGR